MKNELINIAKLMGIVAYILAAIGGIGYTCMLHKYFIALAIAVLAVMAWPTFRSLWPGNNSQR